MVLLQEGQAQFEKESSPSLAETVVSVAALLGEG